jgi:hypothetical protein
VAGTRAMVPGTRSDKVSAGDDLDSRGRDRCVGQSFKNGQMRETETLNGRPTPSAQPVLAPSAAVVAGQEGGFGDRNHADLRRTSASQAVVTACRDACSSRNGITCSVGPWPRWYGPTAVDARPGRGGRAHPPAGGADLLRLRRTRAGRWRGLHHLLDRWPAV